MKEKIKEILRAVPIAGKAYPEYIDALAEKLIAEGVIAPRVKIGDKLFGAWGTVKEYTVTNLVLYGDEIMVCGSDGAFTDIEITPESEIGNGEIFRTREEAEKAIKRSEE